MPRYDYKCSSCRHVYEKREGFDAPPVQQCPDCNGEARRVLTPPAIVFKGSGWYANDSRKGSASRDSAPVPANGKTETSDAKPASSETKSDSPSTTPSTTSAPSTKAAAD